MGKRTLKILTPCGMLGYGFPDSSFARGLEEEPDAIVVDAGSTDAGPSKLGAGMPIVNRGAYARDLRRMLLASHQHQIPLVIGSAGGTGSRVGVEWTVEIIEELVRDLGLGRTKIALVWSDIDKDHVRRALQSGQLEPLGTAVPPLTEDALDQTTRIVAQMGVEPILDALAGDARVIVCGRAYDPAPFAAVAIAQGCDPALSYHVGKVLECGALCCEPGTTKDCMIGAIGEDYFDVYPCNPSRICTPVSVAAHTLYEKDHPFLLHGPGILQDLSQCQYEDQGKGRVRVRGSSLQTVQPYCVKLEGARLQAYRSFVIAGVRDPLLIAAIEEVEEEVRRSVALQFPEDEDYQVRFFNYGKNGVMGELEPTPTAGHELGVLFEALAPTQDKAAQICSSLRSTFLHYGYPGRKSTAGNLAFPFSPSDVNFGPVFAFSVYHLLPVADARALFPIEYIER